MINLIAFINRLKATWIRRCLQKENKWLKIIEQTFNFKNLLCMGNYYTKTEVKNINNPFWKDVLKSFLTLNEINKPIQVNQFLTAPLFNNDNIKIAGKAILYETWYNKGVQYINDLLNKNGRFYTEKEFNNCFKIKTNFIQ